MEQFPSFLTWPLHSTDVVQHIPDFLVAVLQRWTTRSTELYGALQELLSLIWRRNTSTSSNTFRARSTLWRTSCRGSRGFRCRYSTGIRACRDNWSATVFLTRPDDLDDVLVFLRHIISATGTPAAP